MRQPPVKLNIPKAGSKFLWKYMDLHKFIYFVSNEKLFFTRLDKFIDPFEGVTTKLLRLDASMAKVPLDIKSFPEHVPMSEREQYINEKKLHDYIKAQEVERAQSTQYVSCWTAGPRESMAMWSIYSNSDSIAIRASFSKLKFGLESAFLRFVFDNGYRLGIVGDQVAYLKLNPFDENLKKQSLKFSALKKDVSFQYENEYRFLLYTVDRLDRQPPFFEVPIRVNELDLTVVAHPNMEDWKYENLRKLIELSGLEIALERSVTTLRRNFG